MKDEYVPAAPGTAECPHCGATVAGAPGDWTALETAALRWRCPQCRRAWTEFRTPASVERAWTRAPDNRAQGS